MPRYFFHVLNGSVGPDTEGSEFPDIHAARMAAVRLCGEMIQEIDGKFWDAPVWRLEVIDHDCNLLLTLTLAAIEPASG